MKRTFAIFMQGLDREERKTVPRGRPEDLQRWNDTEHISIDIGQAARQNSRVLEGTENTARTNHEEEQVDSAALERIGRAIAFMNEGLSTSIMAQEETSCAGLNSPDEALLLSTLSPRSITAQDAGADDDDESDDRDKDNEANGGIETDFEGAPLSETIRCRPPGAEWSEEMWREVEEAGMLPLSDGDEDEHGEAETGEDGVKWVLARTGQGI